MNGDRAEILRFSPSATNLHDRCVLGGICDGVLLHLQKVPRRYTLCCRTRLRGPCSIERATRMVAIWAVLKKEL